MERICPTAANMKAVVNVPACRSNDRFMWIWQKMIVLKLHSPVLQFEWMLCVSFTLKSHSSVSLSSPRCMIVLQLLRLLWLLYVDTPHLCTALVWLMFCMWWWWTVTTTRIFFFEITSLNLVPEGLLQTLTLERPANHSQLIDYQNSCWLIFFHPTDWLMNWLFQLCFILIVSFCLFTLKKITNWGLPANILDIVWLHCSRNVEN